MTKKQLLFLGASVIASYIVLTASDAAATPQTAAPHPAASEQGEIVRLAELSIDPAQLEAYKAALKEEIATSVRVEPGVLALYAVSVKGHPDQIRIFERYRDDASYRAHLETPHFKKYKSLTANMVKSLTLLETEPISLRSK
jgi:quinol monooxygenase YgiN